MAGFSSEDDRVNKTTTLGQYGNAYFSKITSPVHTAGGWHSTFLMNGSPNIATHPGTDLVYQSCWELGDGAGSNVIGFQHGGVVGPTSKKFVTAVSGTLVGAAGAPWTLQLVDLQAYYRLSTTNVTGTGSRTLINTNTFTASSSSGLLLTYTNDFTNFTKVRFTTTTTLPTGLSLATDYWLVRVSATTARVATSLENAIANTTIAYTDAGTGTHTLTVQNRSTAGVQAMAAVVTAPTGGGPNLSASNYTNQSGTSGRSFQGSPTNGAAADAYASRILGSGQAAGRYGPFLPLQAGDTTVATINSFTWSGGSAYTGSGVIALCLVKPLGAPILIPATGATSNYEFRTSLPSTIEIEDGACLGWLLSGAGATTANSTLTGNLYYEWG